MPLISGNALETETETETETSYQDQFYRAFAQKIQLTCSDT